MARKGFQIAAQQIYDSVRVVSSTGQFMFYCSKKKATWYLEKLLGIILMSTLIAVAESVSPDTIALTFAPKGPGRIGDGYYEHALENVCVSCGSLSDLLRHHVVPSEYRSYFPLDAKSHSSHDIVSLCASCAQRYSAHQTALKKSIMRELGVVETITTPSTEVLQAQRAANALKRAHASMPASRVHDLRAVVAAFLSATVR